MYFFKKITKKQKQKQKQMVFYPLNIINNEIQDGSWTKRLAS